MENRLEELLDALTNAGNARADAKEHADQIADQHPILRELAIIRVMKRDTISSNAAKEIVKSDVEYMEHCVERREAGVAVIRAETEYEVAKARATNGSLITPDVAELQQMSDELLLKNQENARAIGDLEAKLRVARRATDLKEIDLRKMKTYLSHRINDVQNLSATIDSLTQENAKLREGILAPATNIVPVGQYETLEASREYLTAEPYSAEGV